MESNEHKWFILMLSIDVNVENKSCCMILRMSCACPAADLWVLN